MFSPNSQTADLLLLLVEPNEDATPYTFYKKLTDNQKLDAIAGWNLLKQGILTIDTNVPDKSKFTLKQHYKQDYNQAGIRQIMFSSPSTLVVKEIATHSPAEKSGIRKGDIITHFNDRVVSNNDFIWLKDTAYGKNGKTLKITFLRNNQIFTKHLTLSDYLFEQK